MDISARINNINKYFLQFSITNENLSYALVKFPETNVSSVKYEWTLPDTEEISKKYNIDIQADQKGVYFIGTLETIENIFDAIDYVIDFNKDQEERIKLFNAKILELKELFGNEELSELRKLEFKKHDEALIPPIKLNKGKGKKKDEGKMSEKEEENEIKVLPQIENNDNKEEENKNEDSSMMSIVKSIAEE